MPALGNIDDLVATIGYNTSRWCVLRTSGRNTLPLADSLAQAKFEVWTPMVNLRRRAPHGKDLDDLLAPLIPTFVFARARYLSALLDLSNTQRKKQPDFSVFHYLGKIPLIADMDLNGLRISEARKAPRERQRAYATGESVRVNEGGFAGMSGIVEEGGGRYTLVCFGGISVKVATFLLHSAKEMAA